MDRSECRAGRIGGVVVRTVRSGIRYKIVVSLRQCCLDNQRYMTTVAVWGK